MLSYYSLIFIFCSFVFVFNKCVFSVSLNLKFFSSLIMTWQYFLPNECFYLPIRPNSCAFPYFLCNLHRTRCIASGEFIFIFSFYTCKFILVPFKVLGYPKTFFIFYKILYFEKEPGSKKEDIIAKIKIAYLSFPVYSQILFRKKIHRIVVPVILYGTPPYYISPPLTTLVTLCHKVAR